MSLNRHLIVNSGGKPARNEGTESDVIETLDKIEDELEQLREDYEAQMADLKELVNKANEAVSVNSGSYSDIKNEVSSLAEKMTDTIEKLKNVSQKQARFNTGINAVKQSLGSEFVNLHGAELRTLTNGKRNLRLETKNAITSLPASAGGLVVPDRRGMVPYIQQQVWVRDLLAQGTTTSNLIEYPRLNSFTNNAAPVAEGSLKPESDMDFSVENAPVRTIAHWILASKQILDDAPQLMSIIDNMLLYGLKLTEDAQILFGDGTGENLEGIMTVASDFDETLMTRLAVTNPQKADVLRAAILQVINTSLLPADGIVLNPVDAAAIELLKDLNGNYLKIMDDNGRIWRLPVTESPSMPEDEFLVGAFYAGAQIFDREESAVEVSTEDTDNFRRNMVTIRAEERLALAIYYTNAFVKGTFTTDEPTP